MSWLFQARLMAVHRTYIFETIVAPPILATIIFKMQDASSSPAQNATTTLGVAIVGMWAATLSGAGPAMARMRIQGILEPVVAAPTPLATALTANAIASSTVGLLSIPSTFLWVHFMLGVSMTVASPAMLLLAIVGMVLSTAALGLLLSLSLVLHPRAQSVIVIFEYPVWLLIGALVPLSQLPRWVEQASWAIAPSWSMRASGSAITGDPHSAVSSLFTCLGIAALYLAAAIIALRWIEKKAREKATFPLR
ncbi:ABC transporter permease [Streptomyces sp. NPDC057521]|uniref:ABC transporter permease n=1 Tax=Streptomyces sp. NPDC057521 TaxID=3346156 RepID=UPI0036947396